MCAIYNNLKMINMLSISMSR